MGGAVRAHTETTKAESTANETCVARKLPVAGSGEVAISRARGGPGFFEFFCSFFVVFLSFFAVFLKVFRVFSKFFRFFPSFSEVSFENPLYPPLGSL